MNQKKIKDCTLKEINNYVQLRFENDEEGKYTKYSIKYKQNGVLLQIWANSYEVIPLKKLKEIVEK